MKYILLPFFLLNCITIFGQGHLITEFHYDDVYSSPQDSFEFVEVYIPNPQPANLAEYKVILYQGSDSGIPNYPQAGEVFRHMGLDQFHLMGTTPNGAYYVVEFPDTTYFGQTFGGIENGPDGIAFTGPSDVVYKFLSYEGSFAAINGPANGMTSDEITNGNGSSGSPVQENNSTPTTNSLQQNGFDAWTYNVPFSLAAENTSHSGTGFPGNLPVELIDFNVSKHERGSRISWSTATEINNARFELYHSMDGIHFDLLKTIQGSINSSMLRSYQQFHRNLSNGIHYYKLKQIDLDGTTEELGIKSIILDNDQEVSLFPSNTQSELFLKHAKLYEPYTIYDSTGKMVGQGKWNGSHIEVHELFQGLYFMMINDKRLVFNKN